MDELPGWPASIGCQRLRRSVAGLNADLAQYREEQKMCAEYLAKNPPPTLEAQVASFKAKKAEVAPPDQATAGNSLHSRDQREPSKFPRILPTRLWQLGINQLALGHKLFCGVKISLPRYLPSLRDFSDSVVTSMWPEEENNV